MQCNLAQLLDQSFIVSYQSLISTGKMFIIRTNETQFYGDDPHTNLSWEWEY